MVMELRELCKISEKYDMITTTSNKEERVVRPKTANEQRLTYSRSIRTKGQKRVLQKSRSRSLPAISLMPAEKLSPLPVHNVSFDVPYHSDEEIDSVPVRQFSTTYKGLINNGDLRKDSRRDSGVSSTSFRRDSSISVASSCFYSRCDSVFSESSSRRNSGTANYTALPYRRSSVMSEPEYLKLGQKFPLSLSGSRDSVVEETPSQYQVVVLGGEGAGKSAIITQFTTSEFLGTADLCTESDDEKTSLSVILNNEESVIDLIEDSNTDSVEESSDVDIDAYVIVYSCTDRESFKSASTALYRLKEEQRSSKTIVLVANKVDLARKRQVTYEEGRVLAHSYNCKYIETSMAVNHNIDELLVGVLSQIRLKQYGQFFKDQLLDKKKRGHYKGLTGALKTAFRGVFGKKTKLSSCENLYEI